MTVCWEDGVAGTDREQGNLFLDAPWVEAYAANDPLGTARYFSLVQNGLRLPLALRKERVRGVPCSVLRVLGDPLADQCWFGDAQGWDWCAAVQALKKGPTFDLAVFSELRAEAQAQSQIDASARRAGLHTHWRHCGNAPVVPTTVAGLPLSKAQYSKTLTQRLKRGRKKLSAAGEIRIEHHMPNPDEVHGLLEAVKHIEVKSWKGEGSTGLFSGRRLPFMNALSRTLAARGQLEIYFLELDGQRISYRYGFRDQDRFLDYNLAYISEFHHLSPGRILLDEIVKHSQHLGLEAVDASRGSLERPHILADWPGKIRRHYRLTVFGRTLRGHVLRQMEMRLRPLALQLRSRIKY